MQELLGIYSPDMHLADTHVHTRLSPDGRQGLEPEEIIEAAVGIGLHTLAITDHHAVVGAIKAKTYADRYHYPIEVIVGIEVSTNEGHIVGLGVQEPIDKQTRVEEAFEAIRKQQGLVVIPHPFVRGNAGRPNGVQVATLNRLLDQSDEFDPDATEVYSQGAEDMRDARGAIVSDSNAKALLYYNQNRVRLGAALAATDAHRCVVGRAITAFYGDLFHAIRTRHTVPIRLGMFEHHTLWQSSVRRFGLERVEGKRSKISNALRERYRPQADAGYDTTE